MTSDKNCTATFRGTPVITLVNPNSGQQGQTGPGLNVAITGQSTHFAAGTSVVSFGAGITVGTVTVTDATHLTAQISIDAAAALGGRTVTVTTGAEVVSLANGFTVTAPAGCPAQTICGTVTDFETATVALHGIVIELRSSTGAFLQQTTTDNVGKYSFGSLTAPSYFVDPVVTAGEFSSPLQRFVPPGGAPANFSIGGVPASVTITGPSSAFVLFTLQQVIGPPPCQGAGCPVSISGVAPFTFSIPNGTWWLTCYVSPGFSQTSSQQLVFTPQESLTRSCP